MNHNHDVSGAIASGGAMGRAQSSPTERRSAADRRMLSHFQSDWKYAFRGRRRAARRGEDQPLFVDLYEPRQVLLVLGILGLSALDAILTLALIQAGVADEANPVLRWLMAHDIQLFVNLKLVLTSAGIVFLLICSNAPVLRNFRGRSAMHAVLVLYVLVILYELILLRMFGLV